MMCEGLVEPERFENLFPRGLCSGRGSTGLCTQKQYWEFLKAVRGTSEVLRRAGAGLARQVGRAQVGRGCGGPEASEGQGRAGPLERGWPGQKHSVGNRRQTPLGFCEHREGVAREVHSLAAGIHRVV